MDIRAMWELLKEAYREWQADKVPRLGAALAYYSVFSLAPLVVIAIAVAGLVFGGQAARGGVVREIEATVGHPAAEAIEDMLRHTSATGDCWRATAIGLVVLLFGASGVFIQLQDALNTIWKVDPRADRGYRAMLWDRGLSFLLVLGTGLLLLASLVLSAALSAFEGWLTAAGMPGIGLWQAVNAFVSFAVIGLLFTMLYKLLPNAVIAWRDAAVGAFVASLLFTLGRQLIGWYLGQAGTTSAFGAAGSLVVILLWVFYSAQIFLFGAEFARVYAARRVSER